jgi:hypothetical protein
MRHIALWTAASVLLTSHALYAQCRPPNDSHEARLLAFYALPTIFSADPAAGQLPTGAIRLSVEGAPIPVPSASLRSTDYCYTSRTQNTTLARFFGRPRLAIGLPFGFGIEASYLPTVTVGDATPNLTSAALWFTRPVNAWMAFTARVHGTTGSIRGPITCPKSSLQQQDPQAPCYGTSQSRDKFQPNMSGGELITTISPGGSTSRVRLSAGLGANELNPRFQVGFTNLSGTTDHTVVLVNLTRLTGFVSASLRLSSRCDISAQSYTSFGDGTIARGIVGCTLRR